MPVKTVSFTGDLAKVGVIDAHGLATVLAFVKFQRGPEREVGINGVLVEDLLEICREWLERSGRGSWLEVMEGVDVALKALRGAH